MSTCVVREVAWRAPACGLKAAHRPSGRTPICEKHLCRFGRSSTRGPRCFEVPQRLVYSVRDSGGLLPDDTESFFCEDHDRYACRATVEDGSRCPEERLSGTEYCRSHTESVCQARTRSGACRSVAMDDADYCSQHRCASGLGGRGPEGHCRNQRARSTAFCDAHVCIWKDEKGVRCDKQSPHKSACCAKHTCTRCEFGAEDTTSNCIYHLCAWGRRGKGREWPPCAETVDTEGFCNRHGTPRSGTVDRIQRSGTVDPSRMRRRTIMIEEAPPVEYVPATYEEDETEYFSDPEYRPTIPVPRVTKRERSGSSRMMKRLEFRVTGDTSTQGSSQGSWQAPGNWPQAQGGWPQAQGGWSHQPQPQHQEWSLRPWRPSTPY